MSNYANRQVCDVDIRYLATGKPFLFFSDANTTGQTISGDSVYALARGRRKVAFPNPMEGTLTIEAQVLPFEMFALMSDGKILTDGEYFGHEKVVATAAGSIAIAGTPEGKIYVYPAGEVNATSEKEGTFADGKVTATGIEKDKAYEVFYTVKKTEGVKRIRFSDDLIINDYRVDMSTLWKDEDGVYTPVIYRAYKCTPQRNFEMSESSEGDPVSVTITLDMLTDKDGNFFDMIEDTDATTTVSG